MPGKFYSKYNIKSLSQLKFSVYDPLPRFRFSFAADAKNFYGVRSGTPGVYPAW